MQPYGLMADLHLSNWNAFSGVGADGTNTRLNGLLNEIYRCCEEVRKAGGDTIYIAGDVFHVRGSIAPSVLNPTMDVIRSRIEAGFKFRIIPGNHDLEGKHTTRIGSAVTALEGIGCQICNDATVFDNAVMCFPWFDDLKQLKLRIESVTEDKRGEFDLILHAPIDGTLTGIPAHGISPYYLAGLGYRRVFAGHYHHHKDFNNRVYSIGALAHHSWSDVGTKAGFLIVSEEGVRWMKSHLPEFVDITGETDPEELPILVEGNFVRAKTDSSKMEDVEALRGELHAYGARATIIQTVKKPAVARDGEIAASVSAGASLEVSTADFIRGKCFPDGDRVITECMNILAEAGC